MTRKIPLLACLLAGAFVPVHAMAAPDGAPPATLKVGQIPPVEMLTPLPPDESQPPPMPKVADVPPVAGAMPVSLVEIHDLTPADKQSAPGIADAMPPTPNPISNAAPAPAVKTAVMGPVRPAVKTAAVMGPAQPPAATEIMGPVQPRVKVASALAPHPSQSPASLPFPPSADDWSARIPLGSPGAVASAAPVQGDGTSPKVIHVDNRPPPVLGRVPQTQTAMLTPPLLSSSFPDAQPQEQQQQAPQPPVHNFPQNGGVNPPPAHIAVQAAPQQECRSYTRTLDDSAHAGQKAAGMACLGGDGVWRVAEEHLLPHAHAARIHVVQAAPPPVYYAAAAPPPTYYYAAPVQVYQPSYVVAGYGYGYGYGRGYYRGWR